MSIAGKTPENEHSLATMSQYFLILFQDGSRSDRLGLLDRRLFQEVQERLDHVVTTPRESTEIDVWIESPGGDAHAAYKIFLELRSRCKKLRVVIPDFAKSAASLLAIGADEIWMAPAAELGPLDAQVEHPDREGVPVSALDVADAMEFLMKTAIKHLLLGGGQVVTSTGLSRVDVLEQFAKFSAEFFRPVIAKLDPHLIHKATNELVVAGRYATSMLRLRGPADDTEERFQPRQLAQCLVEHYPSHGFVISRGAVKNLGLPMRPAESYNYWPQVKRLFVEYCHGRFAKETEETRENHLVEVWSASDLEDYFSDEGSDDKTLAEHVTNEDQNDHPAQVQPESSN